MPTTTVTVTVWPAVAVLIENDADAAPFASVVVRAVLVRRP